MSDVWEDIAFLVGKIRWDEKRDGTIFGEPEASVELLLQRSLSSVPREKILTLMPRCSECNFWTSRADDGEPDGECNAGEIYSDCNDYTIVTDADFGCVKWKER